MQLQFLCSVWSRLSRVRLAMGVVKKNGHNFLVDIRGIKGNFSCIQHMRWVKNVYLNVYF